MAEREGPTREDPGSHPEIDRAYDRERGGEVPEDQGESDDPRVPSPRRNGPAGDDEDEPA